MTRATPTAEFLRAMVRMGRAMRDGRQVTVAIDERARRRAICGACPEFTGLQCGLCRCVIRWKTMLSTEHCPANPPRW